MWIILMYHSLLYCCMRASQIILICLGHDILVIICFITAIFINTPNKGGKHSTHCSRPFSHQMGRGGAGNKGAGPKSKIILIAQWLSCHVLWMMGYDYNHILTELYEVLDGSDSSDSDESSTNSDISGYESKDSSYEINHSNDANNIDNTL